MKTKTVLLLVALALVMKINAASLGPAVIPAGAARLDNGSLVRLGQPLAGVFGTPGTGGSGHAGFLAIMQVVPPLPTPPAPRIASDFGFGGSAFRLSFEAVTGYTYEVQASRNLVDWTTLQSSVGTGRIVEFTDPEVMQFDSRFYRVLVQ